MNYVNDSLQLLDEMEDIIDDFSSILPEGMEGLVNIEESTGALGLDRLLSEIVWIITGNGSTLLAFLFTLLGLALLMALVDKLGSSMREVTVRAITAITSSVVFFTLLPLFREAEQALTSLNNFFTGLCGFTVAITSMGGGAVSASAQAVSSSLIARLFGAIGSSLSFIVAVLFVLTTLALLSTDGSGGLHSLVKGIFGKGLGILVAGIGGFITLQTIVTGIADSATMRTAKYAIGNLVPVVGGSISGALSTLAGGLEYVSGVVGGGAIAVMLTLSLSPLVLLLAYRLCFFVAIFFLELCSCSFGAKCLSALGGTLDSLIAVFSLSSLIYLFEAVIFIIGGVFIS